MSGLNNEHTHYFYDPVSDTKHLNGKILEKMIRSTFNLKEYENITPAQLDYVLGMIRPTNYLLQHHTIRNQPITYRVNKHDMAIARKHRPWQEQILNDQYYDKCIIKSRQLGLSEVGVSELIWFADTHSFDHVNCLYAFPNYRAMNDFYKQRILPLFKSSGYYSSLTDMRTMSQKQMQIRDSHITFRTSSKSSSLEGVDADYISLDEYDRLNPMAEQSAIESMDSSKYQFIRRWSTPRMPHTGIHRLYETSDQRKWVHKCPYCGYEQVMDYDKNIVLVNPNGIDKVSRTVQPHTFEFVCQKCGKILPRWDCGHWETTSGGAGKRHGYQISSMDAVWVSADELKQKEMQAPSKSVFYNYTLGLPFEDKALHFIPADVLDHLGNFGKQDYRGDYSRISVGIDWG